MTIEYEPRLGHVRVLVDEKVPDTHMILLREGEVVGRADYGQPVPHIKIDGVIMSPKRFDELKSALPPAGEFDGNE